MVRYTTLLYFLMMTSVLGVISCDDGDTSSPLVLMTCDTSELLCDSICVDAQSDSNHCGACGNICPGGQICVAGSCGEANTCAPDQEMCGSSCVNTMSDGMHCGGCNNQCEGGGVCQQGQCQCDNNLTYCGGGCANTTSDPMNCGACLQMCNAGDQCVMGSCQQKRDEVCNNADDDLDGRIDEGPTGESFVVPCDNLCGMGVRACRAGQLTMCDAPMPTPEMCDAVDNDCDGLVDEGVASTYYEDADRDGYGSTDLTTSQTGCMLPSSLGPNGGPYVTQGGDCDDNPTNGSSTYPSAPELPGDDNDCDGTVDEGLECMVGGPDITCGLNVGACRPGTQTCLADATLSECGGPEYRGPSANDVCDGLDEDCDGIVDEGGEDLYEQSINEGDVVGNEFCSDSTLLPDVNENDGQVIYENMSIYRTFLPEPNDVDFYQISATDSLSFCFPPESQCFQFELFFELPNDANEGDYLVCLTVSEEDDACVEGERICSDDPDVFFDPGDRSYFFGFQWGGRCGLNDDRTFTLEVRGTSNLINSCAPYTLKMETFASNDSCDDLDE